MLPALAWRCASSESGRNRLQARSMASISVRSMRSASSACDGSGTTTVAVVPRARNDRVVRLEWRRRHGGRAHRDVPPEVTTGRFFVVVGGDVVVVVVVGGEWLWLAMSMPRRCTGYRRSGVVVGGDDVVVVEVLVPKGTWVGASGGRARPGVLFGHHHADGDGGPGGHQGSGTGQPPKAGFGAPPGLRGVGLAGRSSPVPSSERHRPMEAAARHIRLRASCAIFCEAVSHS